MEGWVELCKEGGKEEVGEKKVRQGVEKVMGIGEALKHCSK